MKVKYNISKVPILNYKHYKYINLIYSVHKLTYININKQFILKLNNLNMFIIIHKLFLLLLIYVRVVKIIEFLTKF